MIHLPTDFVAVIMFLTNFILIDLVQDIFLQNELALVMELGEQTGTKLNSAYIRHNHAKYVFSFTSARQ